MEGKEKTKISSYIITLYVFIMFCIYPFYYENGYYNIGTAKCRFFLLMSVITFSAISVAAIIDLIIYKRRSSAVFHPKKISITEKLLYVYMVIILLSYVFSDFRQNVLWGATDWYIGTIPLLLMSSLACFTMHVWEKQEWMKYACLLVSGIVFLLGICNRFSVYPIPIEPQNPGFISTLGNINWFCGYMSVVSPIGIALFALTENKEYKYNWQKWLLISYVLVAFMVGFCQGSESVLIWNAVLFVALFLIAVKNTAKIKKWLLMISMWGISGQFVRILKALFPEKYNYDTSVFVDTGVTLVIALIAIFLYAITRFSWKEDKELPIVLQNGMRRIILAASVIGILLWLVLAVYNTKIGIPYFMENSLFLLDEKWGNGRGVIFKVSIELFDRMAPLQKLFGVGADGFSAFAYSMPEIKAYLQYHFGDSILTNAHCEIVTNLINLGVLGTAAFVGVFATFVVRCMKKGEKQPYLYIPAICVICYFANNLISFSQVLNIPFLFLILGIGEYYLRNDEFE